MKLCESSIYELYLIDIFCYKILDFRFLFSIYRQIKEAAIKKHIKVQRNVLYVTFTSNCEIIRINNDKNIVSI